MWTRSWLAASGDATLLWRVLHGLFGLPTVILACLAAGRLLGARRPRAARAVTGVGVGLIVVALLPGPGELLLWSLRGPLWRSGSRADAIVVLGGDQLDDGEPGPETIARLTFGARLFKEGAAPLLVVSTGHVGHAIALGETMGRFAVGMGIPEAAVLVEARSRDTHENAVETARLLLPRGARRVALVSEGTHMRRAAASFRRVGFAVVPAPAWPNEHIRVGFPSFQRALTVQKSVREWLGIVWYTARGWT